MRSNAAKYSREKGSSTLRNIVPGMGDLQSLATMGGAATGIYEREEPTYKTGEQKEETQLFQINESIRDLIMGLESNTTPTTEPQDEE